MVHLRFGDDHERLIAHLTFECHSWHAQSFVAETELALTELDEVHEFRHRIQSQQRKEPLVEFTARSSVVTTSQIEELHAFDRQCVDEPCDPSIRTSIDGLDHQIVDAGEDPARPLLEQVQAGLVVGVRDGLDRDVLEAVLLLLDAEALLVEVELELLVRIVDAQLLERVPLEALEPVDVEDGDAGRRLPPGALGERAVDLGDQVVEERRVHRLAEGVLHVRRLGRRQRLGHNVLPRLDLPLAHRTAFEAPVFHSETHCVQSYTGAFQTHAFRDDPRRFIGKLVILSERDSKPVQVLHTEVFHKRRQNADAIHFFTYGEEEEDELDLESIIKELEEELDDEEEEEVADIASDEIESHEEEHHNEGEESEEESTDEIAEEEGEESEEDLDEDIDLNEILREMGYGDDEESDEVSEEEEEAEEGDELDEVKGELAEAMSTIKELKSTINEVNLLNAKLLYTNKLFRSYDLTNDQKMKVVETLDRTGNVREVKLVFSTLAESFKFNGTAKKVKSSKINESFASKPVASTAPKKEVIAESTNTMADRFKKLANIN